MRTSPRMEVPLGKANLKESETALFLKDQMGQLMRLLWEIERQNPTMIPALFNPEPLLAKGAKNFRSLS